MLALFQIRAKMKSRARSRALARRVNCGIAAGKSLLVRHFEDKVDTSHPDIKLY